MFNYNGKAGFDNIRQYIGVIAEDLQQIAPFALDTIYALLDTTDTEPTALLAVNNDAIMYCAVNAIKELDSTLTPLVAAEAATPLYPPAGAVNISPDGNHFLWSDVAGAVSYFLEFSSDPQFGVTEGKTFTRFVINDTMQPMYKEIMMPLTTYYWRVHTIKASGVYTSPVYSFTTAAAPPIALIMPANETTGVNNTLPVNFTWHAISGAGAYKLEVSTDSAFMASGGRKLQPVYRRYVRGPEPVAVQHRLLLACELFYRAGSKPTLGGVALQHPVACH